MRWLQIALRVRDAEALYQRYGDAAAQMYAAALRELQDRTQEALDAMENSGAPGSRRTVTATGAPEEVAESEEEPGRKVAGPAVTGSGW